MGSNIRINGIFRIKKQVLVFDLNKIVFFIIMYACI